MSAPPQKIRKTVRIDPAVLARARELLGTTTDSETIEQALDLVAFKHDAIEGVRAVAGKRLWTDVFDNAATAPPTGHGILKLFGSIPQHEADEMLRAIEEGCERIDDEEPPRFPG